VILAKADVAAARTPPRNAPAATLASGEPNKVGPNLYDVVGRPRLASGFNYPPR
jgi:cytochrome c2